MDKLKKLPGVLSFQRGLIIGDGLMYSLLPDGSEVPLHVMRHGIRGTQNVNKEKAATEASTTANAVGRSVSNVQRTDSAKLHPKSNRLVVRFGIRAVNVDALLFGCAPSKGDDMSQITQFKASLQGFLDRAKETAVLELARRYVRNLVNGRFLWRNRTEAQSIEVSLATSGNAYTFSAFDFAMHDFANVTADEEAVAQELTDGLIGKRDAHILVRAVVDFGAAMGCEVYPSQNYLEEKKKGFARSLYCVGEQLGGNGETGNVFLGQAAIRDQKLGNAIRSIDTWYADFNKLGIAIPVEPMGANLETQLFLRSLKKDSAFKFMLEVDDLDASSDKGLFLLACLIRGGVYSGSESE
jgi:CRISPR-associated protein Csy3